MIKKILPILLTILILTINVGELSASSSKAIALTLKVIGGVRIQKIDTNNAVPLKFGTPLDDGDLIETGDDGQVLIIFADDKSQIKIHSNTQIIISGKRDSKSNIAKRITMEVGQLFAKVEKQRGSLEVVTPTSVASVKGTEFWVVVKKDGTTDVMTIEGLVELKNRISGKIIEVTANFKGTSDPQGCNIIKSYKIEETTEKVESVQQYKTIEIEIQDADGRSRTITIQYLESGEE